MSRRFIVRTALAALVAAGALSLVSCAGLDADVTQDEVKLHVEPATKPAAAEEPAAK